MSLPSDFIDFIKNKSLFDVKERLLIAVSGGVDSVVLCELCHRSGFDFVIAHCNFGLRGKESDDDALFVEEMGKRYAVEVKSVKFDTLLYAEENKVNTQIAARDLRYNWFNEIITSAKGKKIQKILTAHHADDNIETILMNFLKGTGINGLQGIQPKDAGIGGKITRPLLFARKDQLVEFARENQLSWRDDSSNESSKYTRNFCRNELLPAVRKIFPQADHNMLHNIDRMREVKYLYDLSIKQIIQKLVVYEGEHFRIPILKLLKLVPLHSVLFEIFTPFGFSVHQLGEIEKLCHADSGKYIQSDTHRILNNRKWLIISRIDSSSSDIIIINENDAKVNFGTQKLLITISEPPQKFDSDLSIVHVNVNDIKYPLLLRKWKQGDYFYPLGMQKKKKLSRFFIDNKLSLTEKEKIWVLESNKKIVWVLGLRIDDRFKITPTTKNVLKLSITE